MVCFNGLCVGDTYYMLHTHIQRERERDRHTHTDTHTHRHTNKCAYVYKIYYACPISPILNTTRVYKTSYDHS